MDRKEFLKTAGGLGVCGCLLSTLGFGNEEKAAEVPDQRLAFAQLQVANLVRIMSGGDDPQAYVETLEKTGRECAKLGGIPIAFQGRPEEYFAAAHKAWGTDFTWDRVKGTVSVSVAEGECKCPLVDSRHTPAFWCNCSVGYQKETFEHIFGRPVKVALQKSKLDGHKHCVFEVTLS